MQAFSYKYSGFFYNFFIFTYNICVFLFSEPFLNNQCILLHIILCEVKAMLKKYKPYIIQILIALFVGGLAGLITRGSFNVYGELIKPALAPPPIVFPIVWGILYVLMGISAGIVYQTERRIPFIYWLQLFVNFLWPIIFFNMQAFLFAFVWIVLLLILIVFMIIEFYRIHKTAAYLQIPYLLWTLFATYLTFFIWLYSTY